MKPERIAELRDMAACKGDPRTEGLAVAMDECLDTIERLRETLQNVAFYLSRSELLMRCSPGLGDQLVEFMDDTERAKYDTWKAGLDRIDAALEGK